MEPNKKKYATLSDLNNDKDGNTVKHYTGSDASGTYHQQPDEHLSELHKLAQQQKNSGGLKNKQDCKIVIYNNGFQVDDDEFVPLTQEQMQKMIETMKNGMVPPELKSLQQKYGNDLQPDIEFKPQDYRPPTPPKHVAYSGQGMSLGGQTTQAGQINLQAGQIQVNKDKPTTSIQIRLHDGQTKQIEINLDDKVETIFQYVQNIAPAGSFQLIAGFPPKPLTDRNATIEDADLEDSRIQQKIE